MGCISSGYLHLLAEANPLSKPKHLSLYTLYTWPVFVPLVLPAAPSLRGGTRNYSRLLAGRSGLLLWLFDLLRLRLHVETQIL